MAYNKDDTESVCSRETVPFEPLSPEEKIRLNQGIAAPQRTSSPERVAAPERTLSPKRTMSREEGSQVQETFPNEDLQSGKVNWNERIKYVMDWVKETKKTCDKGECIQPFENCDDKSKVKMSISDAVVEISDDEDLNQEMPKSIDSGVVISMEERQDVADPKTTEKSKHSKRKHSSNSKRSNKKFKTAMKDIAVGEDHSTLKSFCDGSIQTDLPILESNSTQTRPPFCFNAVVQTDSVMRCTKNTQTCLVSTKNAFCQTSPFQPDAGSYRGDVGMSPMRSPQRRSNFHYPSKEGRSLMQRSIELVNSHNIKEFVMLCVLYQSLLDQNDLMMYLSNRNANCSFENERSNMQQTRRMVKDKAVAHLLKVKSSYKMLTRDEMSYFKSILMESTIDWANKPSCHVKFNMNFNPFSWVTDLLNEVMDNVIKKVSETDSNSKVGNDDQAVKVEVSHKSPVYGDLPPEAMTVVPLDSNALQVGEILDCALDNESSDVSDRQSDVQQESLPLNLVVQNQATNEVSVTCQVSDSQVSEPKGTLSSSQAPGNSCQVAGSVLQVLPVPPEPYQRNVQTSCSQTQFAPANSSMVSESPRSVPSLPPFIPFVGPSCSPVVPTQSAYEFQMGMNQYNQQQMQRNLITPQQNPMPPPNQTSNSISTSFLGNPSAQSPLSLTNVRLQVRKDLMQPPQRFSSPLQYMQRMQSAYNTPGAAQVSPAQVNNQIPVHITQHPVRMSDISTQMRPLNANHQLHSGMRPQSLAWPHNGPYQPNQSLISPRSYVETTDNLRNVRLPLTRHPFHHPLQVQRPQILPPYASSAHQSPGTLFCQNTGRDHQFQVQRPQTLPPYTPSAHQSPGALPCQNTARDHQLQRPQTLPAYPPSVHNFPATAGQQFYPAVNKAKKKLPLRRMSTSQIDFPPSVRLQDFVPIMPKPPSQQQMTPQRPKSVIVLPRQILLGTPDQTATQIPLISPPRPPNSTPQTASWISGSMIGTVASSYQSCTDGITTLTAIPVATTQVFSNLAPAASPGSSASLLMPPPPVPAKRVRRCRTKSVDSIQCSKKTTKSMGLSYTTTAGIINQTTPQKTNHQSVESNRQEGTSSTRSRDQESVKQISQTEHAEGASTDERQPLISPEVLNNIRKSMKVCNICDGKSYQICAGCLSAVYCSTECEEMDGDHLCDQDNKHMVLF